MMDILCYKRNYKQYKKSKYNFKYDIMLNYLSNLSKNNQFKNKI